MRRGLVAVVALAGLCGLADRASAQVIYYNTPVYYTTPFNPLVRTYSMPVVYSTYTSPSSPPVRLPAVRHPGLHLPAARREHRGRRRPRPPRTRPRRPRPHPARCGQAPADDGCRRGHRVHAAVPGVPPGRVHDLHAGPAAGRHGVLLGRRLQRPASAHFYTPYAYAPYADPYVPYYYSGAATTTSAAAR